MTEPAGTVLEVVDSIVGRVVPASNATFVGTVDGRRVVYKPIAGERPLWDFPEGTLAGREIAAYAVSESLGWQIVPRTRLAEGPHGPGMVQDWVDPDPGRAPVDVVGVDNVPAGYRHVLDALDADERPVALVHEDSPALRRMAILDIVINNGDRKGGHVLAAGAERVHGVDHGVSFHVDPKLRTVLWGWLGEPLTEYERTAVRDLVEDDRLTSRLAGLLATAEVDAFHQRCRRLVSDGVFPAPSGEWPAIPWPAF